MLRTIAMTNWLAICLAICFATCPGWSGLAFAADPIRLAAQRTGTLAWEVDVVLHHGLDKKAGVNLQLVRLASPEAQKIALKGGVADIIVADWLWVARERALGDNLQFYPFSSAVGSLMVPSDSSVRSLRDLRGRKLGVAGGPLDKSWAILRALALREGVNIETEASIVFGAPPLLAQKALQGEVDAVLNYWNFSAALAAKGFRSLLSMEEAQVRLGADAGIALLGYAFDAHWAASNPRLANRFLAMMKQAKTILSQSDSEWSRISKLVRAPDEQTLVTLRDHYRRGIPRRDVDAEHRDAKKLLDVLLQSSGRRLLGPVTRIDGEMYFRPEAGL